ncbi:hypothetical protein KW797_01775 [Candidatus Parcubacteria bacterium]|nr:hypothetical protein [Candidatus Parcubacteria bacterium]
MDDIAGEASQIAEGRVVMVCLDGKLVERMRITKITKDAAGNVQEIRGATLDTIPGREWEFGRVGGVWKKSFLQDPASREQSYSRRGPTFELVATNHS